MGKTETKGEQTQPSPGDERVTTTRRRMVKGRRVGLRRREMKETREVVKKEKERLIPLDKSAGFGYVPMNWKQDVSHD